MAAWLVCEVIRTKRATVIGGITGAVAGLATITPAAGYVNTLAALAIGVIAGVVCTLALKLKMFFKFDDALDVIAVVEDRRREQAGEKKGGCRSIRPPCSPAFVEPCS